jgi:hypothetical protein
LYAKENHEEAAEMIRGYLASYDRENINILYAINYTSKYFGIATICGKIDVYRVNSFLTWLVENGIESSQILDQKLFTNELILC